VKVQIEIEIPDGYEIESGPELDFCQEIEGRRKALGFGVYVKPVDGVFVKEVSE
jgi:hypothetical protein